MPEDELNQMIETALAAPTREAEAETPPPRLRLLSAAAIRRALPKHLRISNAAVRALQAGLEAYATDAWAWAGVLARLEGRAGPRPGAVRLGARMARN
jgi:hypothetical protein